MKKTKLDEFETLLEQRTSRRYGTKAQRTRKFAAVYTRVSSQEQAENNGSLEIQLKLCQEFAIRHSIVIKEYFGSTYESAKSDVERKEFTRMLEYVRKDKDISYIIVYSFDRFSRTGAAASQLSEKLRSQGIIVKSVMQDVDNSTASGQMQEGIFHMFNHYDNKQRSQRTSTNTREIMLKGYWPYQTPFGYQNSKPKHRACDHEYKITSDGKILKRMFQWKAEGLSTKEILEKSRSLGLTLSEKNFRWILSNSFYAGYVTGKLVNGKLIKGKHPPLVDVQTFLRANDVLKTAVNVGIPKQHKRVEVPLKMFARDEYSKVQFTGYIKKGNWYYKSRAKGTPVNVNAKHLNALFGALLSKFECKKEYKDRLRILITEGLKAKFAENIQESTNLKKQLSIVKNNLEKIEERYALGEITQDVFRKFFNKYSLEISKTEQFLADQSFDSSNLEKTVEKGLEILSNISRSWGLAGYDEKQRLQNLVFPEGITYDKKNDVVRTPRVNTIFASIPRLQRALAENKNDNHVHDCHFTSCVPRTGIEPAHHC